MEGFDRPYSGDTHDLLATPEDDQCEVSRSERGPVGMETTRASLVGLIDMDCDGGSAEGILCLKVGFMADRGPEGMFVGSALSGV